MRCTYVDASTLSVSQPWAASFLEKNFWLSGPRYDREMPTCDYAPALDRIIANFHTKEARFWNSQLEIVGIRTSARRRCSPGRHSPFRAGSAAALR